MLCLDEDSGWGATAGWPSSDSRTNAALLDKPAVAPPNQSGDDSLGGVCDSSLATPMSHVSFHPDFNGWLLLLVALVATALVAMFYRRAYGALRQGQWMRLYGLRMTAIAIVLNTSPASVHLYCSVNRAARKKLFMTRLPINYWNQATLWERPSSTKEYAASMTFTAANSVVFHSKPIASVGDCFARAAS